MARGGDGEPFTWCERSPSATGRSCWCGSAPMRGRAGGRRPVGRVERRAGAARP
ncbi:hypothetical protein PAI11_44420 [Patulibacter medicamentivorans]|uniref:Uncharacterized protein n=1 Tax=Patulibacter medicamentivorans TaxID=1097667 RepID=H0EC64_9ACTN|nr:hypothetical protein PAI11_44420 [Patulibacter medicamentivorans]